MPNTQLENTMQKQPNPKAPEEINVTLSNPLPTNSPATTSPDPALTIEQLLAEDKSSLDVSVFKQGNPDLLFQPSPTLAAHPKAPPVSPITSAELPRTRSFGMSNSSDS
jgi:hypothetical protein